MNLSRLKKAEFIKTLETNLFTDRTVLLDNEPYSKSMYMIKSLDFSNSSSASRTITVWFVRNGVYYDLMTDFVIPAKASINALGNDITLYLERGDSIVAISSVTDNTVKAVCNYVQISSDISEPMDKSYTNFFPKTLDVFAWANDFTPTNMTLSRDVVNISPVGVSPLSMNISSSSSSLNSFNTFASNINIAFKNEKWLVEFYAQSDTPTDFILEVYGAFANGNTNVNSDFFNETFSVTQAWKKYKLEVDFVEDETSFIQVNFKGSSTTTVRIDNLRVQRIGQAISGFNVVGGTEAIVDGVKYHTFNSTDQIFVAGSKLVNVVLVAGGGGGGMAFASTPRHGGGGGAGGLREIQTTVNSGTYNAVVGAGGSGSTATANKGNNGSNSSIFGFTSTGGGGGGSTGNLAGSNGGSGGGAGRSGTTFAAGGTGISDQGFSGATSTSSGSGGGGGKGGAGTVTSGGTGFSFNGSTYAVGGNGTNTSVNTAGNSAGSNTGSGGDGGSTGGIGGNGGSGTIIVYYEV